MARVGLKRQLAPGLNVKMQSSLATQSRGGKALALLAAAIVTFSKRCSFLQLRLVERNSAIDTSSKFRLSNRSCFRLPAANAQPPRFALRVCEKCVAASAHSCCIAAAHRLVYGPPKVSRQAGNGYNPKGVLQQTARMAAEARAVLPKEILSPRVSLRQAGQLQPLNGASVRISKTVKVSEFQQ